MSLIKCQIISLKQDTKFSKNVIFWNLKHKKIKIIDRKTFTLGESCTHQCKKKYDPDMNEIILKI